MIEGKNESHKLEFTNDKIRKDLKNVMKENKEKGN
jgi:hypothetical protein